MEEKPLFQFKNHIDVECYNRLQDFYISVIQKTNMIMLLVFYILSIFAFVYGIFFLNADIISYLIVEGIFTLLVLIVFTYPKLRKRIHEKMSNSRFHRKEREQRFSFYGDYLLLKEKGLEVKYKYSRIFRVYVTNEDYFFRINKNITLILPKDKVSKNDEFFEFLERKFQQRFIKKYNKNNNGGVL